MQIQDLPKIAPKTLPFLPPFGIIHLVDKIVLVFPDEKRHRGTQ